MAILTYQQRVITCVLLALQLLMVTYCSETRLGEDAQSAAKSGSTASPESIQIDEQGSDFFTSLLQIDSIMSHQSFLFAYNKALNAIIKYDPAQQAVNELINCKSYCSQVRSLTIPPESNALLIIKADGVTALDLTTHQFFSLPNFPHPAVDHYSFANAAPVFAFLSRKSGETAVYQLKSSRFDPFIIQSPPDNRWIHYQRLSPDGQSILSVNAGNLKITLHHFLGNDYDLIATLYLPDLFVPPGTPKKANTNGASPENSNDNANEEGMATANEEGMATGNEEGMATANEEGMATGNEEGMATANEEGMATAEKMDFTAAQITDILFTGNSHFLATLSTGLVLNIKLDADAEQPFRVLSSLQLDGRAARIQPLTANKQISYLVTYWPGTTPTATAGLASFTITNNLQIQTKAAPASLGKFCPQPLNFIPLSLTTTIIYCHSSKRWFVYDINHNKKGYQLPSPFNQGMNLNVSVINPGKQMLHISASGFGVISQLTLATQKVQIFHDFLLTTFFQ